MRILLSYFLLYKKKVYNKMEKFFFWIFMVRVLIVFRRVVRKRFNLFFLDIVYMNCVIELYIFSGNMLEYYICC